jgi:hypothetical protein
MSSPLRDFLEIPYDKLEEMNLATKEARLAGRPRTSSARSTRNCSRMRNASKP